MRGGCLPAATLVSPPTSVTLTKGSSCSAFKHNCAHAAGNSAESTWTGPAREASRHSASAVFAAETRSRLGEVQLYPTHSYCMDAGTMGCFPWNPRTGGGIQGAEHRSEAAHAVVLGPFAPAPSSGHISPTTQARKDSTFLGCSHRELQAGYLQMSAAWEENSPPSLFSPRPLGKTHSGPSPLCWVLPAYLCVCLCGGCHLKTGPLKAELGTQPKGAAASVHAFPHSCSLHFDVLGSVPQRPG